MKRTFLNASLIAGSFLVMTACGNGEKSGDRSEEIYEKHLSQEDMYEQQHEKIVEAEEVRQFDQPDPEFQSQVSTLLNDYLSIKNALVENSAVEAQTAAGQMLGKIKNFNSSELSDEQQSFYDKHVESMRDDLRFMAQNTDLEKHRDHFARLTTHTYALAKAVNGAEQTLYYQYCPMAFDNQGGYWLSAQEEILNPYYGDKMLKCGRVEETISN